MIVSLILAVSENGVIGRDNQLPWHLPADLRFFKRTTLDHSVVMGRKTFEAVGKPLPRRRNIVVTRNPDWHSEGVERAGSLEDALEMCAGEEEVFIIGGGTIYAQALDQGLANRIYLTRVHAEVEGDAFFRFDESEWQLHSSESHSADEKNQYAMSFLVLTRPPADG